MIALANNQDGAANLPESAAPVVEAWTPTNSHCSTLYFTGMFLVIESLRQLARDWQKLSIGPSPRLDTGQPGNRAGLPDEGIEP